MDEREKYKLSEAQNEELFRRDVLPEVLDNAGDLRRVERPTMLVIGGQPGAGKSSSIDRISKELEPRGGVIKALVDELREFHPLNDQWMRANDRTASNYTLADAKIWAQKIENVAVERATT